MSKIARQFIRKIPKTDLHVHLDGSLRIGSLIEMAKREQVELPSYEESGLNELVFKDRYKNLGEYLSCFTYTVGVLQTEEHLERAAFELAEDAHEEGVRYMEVRFAPQLHINHSTETAAIVQAVNRGLHRAKRHLNASIGENDLAFEYGIILCALRCFTRHMSPYYNRLINRCGSSRKRLILSLIHI